MNVIRTRVLVTGITNRVLLPYEEIGQAAGATAKAAAAESDEYKKLVAGV